MTDASAEPIAADATSDDGPGRLVSRTSLALLLFALVVAALHMAPFWRAQAQTPDGWEFTGNLKNSPDVMQYRVLTLRTQDVGPVVENRMTAEETAPHIPMIFYWSVASLASAIGASTEFTLEYVGALLSVVLVFLLFFSIRRFLRSRYQTWWVLLVVAFGGGLGGHMLLMKLVGPIRSNVLFQRIVSDGLKNGIVFDQYRNHYVFNTWFDTHFLFFLIMALVCVVALHATVRSFSWGKVAMTAALFAAATALHIYDGVTLVFIGLGVIAVLKLRGLPIRDAVITTAACSVTTAAAILWQVYLYKSSGIELPAWRAQSVLFAELAIAYPVAWGLMAWGFARYWREATFDECFLLGWTLGCVTLTLAGPFYPYPDRGTLTLQIPIYIIAGAIFFARWRRVGIKPLVVAVALLGATPLWVAREHYRATRIDKHPSGGRPPYVWMSPEHVELAEALWERGEPDDVLMVDKTPFPWTTDDLWLAPGFRGRLFAGHYALTPRYDVKQAALGKFYEDGDSTQKAAFLAESGATFVYVSADKHPADLAEIPTLVPVVSNSVGTLYEHDASAR